MSLPLREKSNDDADAFVLAGGRSSRMGQDKALVQLAGAPLIQHAIEIFRAAGLNPRIAGATTDVASFAPVIPDDPRDGGLGPLSGICSALEAASTQYSIFLPVDLPLVPVSLISYLIHYAIITESTVTVVSVAGFIQTFPAVIDRAAAPALQASLRSTDRKCLTAFRTAADSVAGKLAVVPIEFLLQPGQVRQRHGMPPAQWFLNINTPVDLARSKYLHDRT